MNSMEINGQIVKKWSGFQKDGLPINIVLIDNDLKEYVYFKTACWDATDCRTLSKLKEGDEISFSGYFKSVHVFRKGFTVEIGFKKLLSCRSVERTTIVLDEDVSSDVTGSSQPQKGG